MTPRAIVPWFAIIWLIGFLAVVEAYRSGAIL